MLTNAEWEFAARGGIYSPRNLGGVLVFDYFYSNGNDGANVWFADNPATGSRTHPVGQFNSNVLGLYDMSGNVWELCWDLIGTFRVGRGGSWNVGVASSRVSDRGSFAPSTRAVNTGIRLASSSVE